MTDERLAEVKAQTASAVKAQRLVKMDSWELMQLVNEVERRRAEERERSAGETTHAT